LCLKAGAKVNILFIPASFFENNFKTLFPQILTSFFLRTFAPFRVGKDKTLFHFSQLFFKVFQPFLKLLFSIKSGRTSASMRVQK